MMMTTEQQKAFEVALAPDEYDFRKDSDGAYSDVATRIAYRGWQAAIEWHKQHMQTPEMVERVANRMMANFHKTTLTRTVGGCVELVGGGFDMLDMAKEAIAAITE